MNLPGTGETGGKFIQTENTASSAEQGKLFKNFERQLCELRSGQDFYLPESLQ